MKKIFYIALTAVLGLAGTSCDREKLTYDSEPGEISGKTGTLDLSSFDAIPNNDIKETEKKPVSRAVDTGGFTVQIFRSDNGSEPLEKNWKYSETPEIVTLNVGNYNLKVFSHEVQPSEWEKPYYYADKTFSIEENRVTQIDTLVCTLQNIGLLLRGFKNTDGRRLQSIGYRWKRSSRFYERRISCRLFSGRRRKQFAYRHLLRYDRWL